MRMTSLQEAVCCSRQMRAARSPSVRRRLDLTRMTTSVGLQLPSWGGAVGYILLWQRRTRKSKSCVNAFALSGMLRIGAVTALCFST